MSKYEEVIKKYDEEKIKEIFEPLEEYRVDDFNIFTILGITRTEIRHSNVLAYLLNPTGNHGLGSQFLNLFLNFLKEQEIIEEDFEGFMEEIDHYTVTREELHMDITLKNRRTNKRIVIENKIDSVDYEASENDKGQLEKYRTKIKDAYSKEKVIYIYLTPNGDNPIEQEERKYWKNLSYRAIFDLLKNLNLNNVSQKVIDFIEDYKKIIEVYIMKNEELVEKCTKIYNKHRAFFEMVLANKKDYVLELVKECLNDFEPTYLSFREKDQKENHLYFTIPNLKKYIKDNGLQDNSICYSIWIQPTSLIVYLFYKCRNTDITNYIKSNIKNHRRINEVAEKDNCYSIQIMYLDRHNLTLEEEEDKEKITRFLKEYVK